MQPYMRAVKVSWIYRKIALTYGLSTSAGHRDRRFGGNSRSPLIVLLFIIALGMPVTSFDQCGGAGQRACCNGDLVFSNNSGACNTGASFVPGCIAPDCSCSGGLIKSEQSSGMCYVPVGCGGEGQRACCNGRGEFSNNGLACNSGLVQVPGCDGSVAGNCAYGHWAGHSQGTCVQPT